MKWPSHHVNAIRNQKVIPVWNSRRCEFSHVNTPWEIQASASWSSYINNYKRLFQLLNCRYTIDIIYTMKIIKSFHSRGQNLWKFIGTKEIVCIRKEFNFQRTGLGHQHGRRFIVLGHQYGRRDVMWKHSIQCQCFVKISREMMNLVNSFCFFIKQHLRTPRHPTWICYHNFARVAWRFWLGSLNTVIKAGEGRETARGLFFSRLRRPFARAFFRLRRLRRLITN